MHDVKRTTTGTNKVVVTDGVNDRQGSVYVSVVGTLSNTTTSHSINKKSSPVFFRLVSWTTPTHHLALKRTHGDERIAHW